MRATAALEPLYRQAAAATAKGSKSFYFATRFFPQDLARAAHAVYWFCRYTDDLVDECETLEQGRNDLESWAASLAARADHPVLNVFFDTADTYRIPVEYAFELIKGVRMDLNQTRYATFEELKVFCYRVASVVGLMMSHVIGFADAAEAEQALPRAVELGYAMQLTNILRDIGEDLDRNRIYLPQDEMRRFGYSEEELRDRVRNDAFRALMRHQVERARQFYRSGNRGIPQLKEQGRFAVQVASDVYSEILTRVEASDYDVFEHRAVVPATRKYWMTMRRMAAPIARHTASRLAFWRS